MMLFLDETFDQPASSFFPDRRVRAIFEDLLRLRQEAEAGNLNLHDARDAARQFSNLAVALLSWLAPLLDLRVPDEQYRRMPARDRRALIARTVRLGLPTLQPKALDELASALEAANVGHTEPLFQPHNKVRRGRAPHRVAEAQLHLLMWIRWQHGLGRKVADVETEVAQAVCCTREAIQKWRAELQDDLGEHHVRQELELAERVGRFERSGRDWKEVDRRESDDNERLCQCASTLWRELDELVLILRVAKRKRPVAKSRDR